MGLKTRAAAILKLIFWALLIYFCLVFLIPKWQSLQLSDRLTTLGASWLAAAAILMVVYYIYVFGLWVLLLRQLGARPKLSLAFRAYALSQLAKYMPGKIVSHGVRAAYTLEADVPPPVVSSSLVWEAMLTLGSAAFIALLTLFTQTSMAIHQASRWLVIAFALGSIAFAAVGSTRLLGSGWKRWVGLLQLRSRPLAAAGLFALYLCGWPIFGLCNWLLANSITSLSFSTLLPLTGALAVSWGLGYVSVFAPAGLGVREGVLYLFVLGIMDEGDAILYVALSRVLGFAVEVLLTAVWGLLSVTPIGGVSPEP